MYIREIDINSMDQLMKEIEGPKKLGTSCAINMSQLDRKSELNRLFEDSDIGTTAVYHAGKVEVHLCKNSIRLRSAVRGPISHWFPSHIVSGTFLDGFHWGWPSPLGLPWRMKLAQ